MIAHHPGAAAHIGDFGVVIPLLVILQVEGGVDEAEVGEQPLGRRLDGQLEQVVVGIAGVVVDPFLHLEDLHRENRGFPVCPAPRRWPSSRLRITMRASGEVSVP